MASPRLLFKIIDDLAWKTFIESGWFTGAGIDLTDGYIHFSYADQVEETARKHFHGRENLVLLAVDPLPLGEALKDEPSRGGALFPHLYAPLPLRAVLWDKPIALDPAGIPLLPPLERGLTG